MRIYSKVRQEITQKYYQENFSNDGQRFIAWYLRNIYGLDELEAIESITDGPNDNKIDAVYINHQDEAIYILFRESSITQSKDLILRLCWKLLQHGSKSEI